MGTEAKRHPGWVKPRWKTLDNGIVEIAGQHMKVIRVRNNLLFLIDVITITCLLSGLGLLWWWWFT